jgi:HTH-type transcriptional regulator/antitoxin HipB
MALTTSEQLAASLRYWRKKRQLTQVQVAERIGLAQKAISALETETGKVSVERLLQLLSALGLEIELRDKEAENPAPQAW